MRGVAWHEGPAFASPGQSHVPMVPAWVRWHQMSKPCKGGSPLQLTVRSIAFTGTGSRGPVTQGGVRLCYRFGGQCPGLQNASHSGCVDGVQPTSVDHHHSPATPTGILPENSRKNALFAAVCGRKLDDPPTGFGGKWTYDGCGLDGPAGHPPGSLRRARAPGLLEAGITPRNE